MLETALATGFEPGTNRRGSAAGAGWVYLLPGFDLERVLCLGAPGLASLATLSRIARSFVVWCPVRRHARLVAAAAAAQGWSNVRIVETLPSPPRIPADGFDLVCLPSGAGRSLGRSAQARMAAIPELLAPGAAAYVESGPSSSRLRAALETALGRAGFTTSQRMWVTPRRGEAHAAAPAAFPEAVRYLVERGLHWPDSPAGTLDRIARAVAGKAIREHPTRRSAVLAVAPRLGGDPVAVPRYVAELAQGAGIDVAGHRWALSARGRFSSRKVVLFLFPPGGGAPDYVVKMTREPRHNHRLENEHQALLQLQREGVPGAESRPEVAFFGHHGGIAVLGERAVEGMPFDEQTAATADCRYAGAAVDRLTDLAAATADPLPAGSADLHDALHCLLESYERLYRPSPAERAALAGHVASLASHPLAAVFAHGDPGTWNLVAGSSGAVTFLDWEAAEPRALPLWDLFHFFRSYGVLASRRAGTRDALDGFTRQFLRDTPLSRLLEGSLATYTTRLSLASDLVPALFFTGWVHRALKEATRLPPDRLGRGHYVRLLRLCLAEGDNPVLRRVLAAAS